MTTRKARSKVVVSPTPEQLRLLERQIQEHIEEGERLAEAGCEAGEEDAWDGTALDLIEQAVGSGVWTDAFEDAARSAPQADRDPYAAYDPFAKPDPEADRKDRVLRIGNQLPVLRNVLKQIDRRVDLARAVPTAPAEPMTQRLEAQDFGFMRSPKLRVLAARDYAELGCVLAVDATLKSRAVLAGAVVEAILLDMFADGRSGVPPSKMLDMTLGALIEAAKTAGKISDKVTWVAKPVKDFRNLGHPGAELRDGELATTDANIAVELMKMVIAEASKESDR